MILQSLFDDDFIQLFHIFLSGFGGGSEEENCKNAIGVLIMGQVYAYDRAVETMRLNPTGQFFCI